MSLSNDPKVEQWIRSMQQPYLQQPAATNSLQPTNTIAWWQQDCLKYSAATFVTVFVILSFIQPSFVQQKSKDKWMKPKANYNVILFIAFISSLIVVAGPYISKTLRVLEMTS